MDNPAITYDELKAALEEDSCARITEPALFALLDKLIGTTLFGRWATHPEHGRGIIVSCKPDGEGEVRFAYRNGSYTDGVDTRFVRLANLTLDPVTLPTVKDFNDAPEGTIVEIMVEPKGVYVKKDNVWFGAGGDYPIRVQSLAKARVIRWGNGQ